MSRSASLGAVAAALVVSLVISPVSARASAAAPALAPDVVIAEVERANRYFAEGLYPEALTTLDALAARLDPDTLRAQPLIMVMRGRTLDALGRALEALDAFDRALAWSAPDSVAHRHAERWRAALLETAFSTLRVRCRAPVERVRLVERGDERPCPAVWAPLPAGRWTVEGRGPGVEVTAKVTAERGAVQVVELSAPHAIEGPSAVESRPRGDVPAGWAVGVLAGVGAAVIGSSAVLRERDPGLAVHVAGQVERRLARWLSLGVELGLTYAQMGFLLADALEVDAGTLSWLTAEAALLARPCARLGEVELCGAPGVATAWLLHAEQAQPGAVASPAEHGTDTLHLGARFGVEVRLPVGGVASSLGVHVLYSPWPGAVGFTDGALPYLRGWLDAGVWF